MTATDLAAHHRKRAIRFMWIWLAAFTAVSLGLNIWHAILTGSEHRDVRTALAFIAPVALLASVHAIAHLTRANASGAVYRTAVGSIATVAAFAFWISFISIRDLAIIAGYSRQEATVFPLIVDTVIGVATLALVAIGDKPPRRVRGTNRAQNPSQSAARPAPPGTEIAPAQSANTEARKPLHRVNTDVESANPPAEFAPDTEEIALRIATSRTTTQPVQTVVAVLDALAAGASVNGAATAAGVNFRTAQRIAKAADAQSIPA